jgi:ATP-dependent protease ClpP protease subunit
MCYNYCMDNEETERPEDSKVILVSKSIYLIGDVDPNLVGEFLSALKEADSTEGDLDIYIASDGGWAEGGIAMYDAIRACKNLINTIAVGAVSSAAVLPFVAGDTRAMYKGARMFLHPLSLHEIHGGSLSIDVLKSTVKEMENLERIYCQYVAESSSHLGPKDVKHLCDCQTYLSSSECLELGLSDSTIQENPKKKRNKRKK